MERKTAADKSSEISEEYAATTSKDIDEQSLPESISSMSLGEKPSSSFQSIDSVISDGDNNSESPGHENNNECDPSSDMFNMRGDYVLVHSSFWSNILCNMKCSECNSSLLETTMNNFKGFATKINITCLNC